MTPLELLAILVLAGAIVVLLYYYMLDNRNESLIRARSVITETGEKARSAVSAAVEKVTIEGSMIDGVSEKMSGMSEKIKGTVKGVPKTTDSLSNKIDLFLNDKSDQLIKDWELATKDDIVDLENRYGKVSRDLGELDGRFNEYRGFTNKKLKKIEERLEKLETPDE